MTTVFCPPVWLTDGGRGRVMTGGMSPPPVDKPGTCGTVLGCCGSEGGGVLVSGG